VYISSYRRRADAAFVLFFIFFSLCIARLFYIQAFRSDYLARIAKKQHNFFIAIEPRRGTIYDRNMKPQAVNLAYDSVYASPNMMKAREKFEAAHKLGQILKIDPGMLYKRLMKGKAFVWISRKIDPEQSEQIKQAKIKNIGFVKESKRCYPNSYLLSHVMGFAGLDNIGLEGLEMHYDQYLKGQPGWEFLVRDARSKKLNLYDNRVLPQDGYDLVLTVDEVIQYIAEREIDKIFQLYRAKGASIIVMEPKTGQILAMANRPGFDLNYISKFNKDEMRNRAVCDMFEPGSVFKIVPAAAALEEKKVDELSRFFCENGEYKVAGRVLHDHRPHGWLTFREVVELSSNIGTAKVAALMGPDTLYRYIKLFGFGVKSGVDMPGEISGRIASTKYWSKTSMTCIPMGQEVGVTALQMANALSVIANGGLLMKPYIVKEILSKQGDIVKKTEPAVVRRVISAKTAARMRKILIGVIENGTGKLAKGPDFTAGGKTGTAQKIEPNGKYSHSKYIASFIGFAPAEDPQLAVVVMVDEPRGYYYGGVVSAPAFKNVVSDTLKYLQTRDFSNGALLANETN
jgi:cell division protein FtsI/penicillin-binding protein 2